jgi:methionine aminotransferase
MRTLNSRLPEVGISIFTVMSNMALDQGAINLGQGFPDFPVSERLVDLIHQKMKEGHNQYAPMPGTPALRKIISQVVEKTYARPTDFETEVTITAGGTEALFATIAALIGSGDEVIVFDPAYDSYDPAIRLNGGVPVHVNLTPPDFSIDWNEVRSKITARTRMIMVNTPHNPTGSILSQSDLQNLEQIAEEHDLLILSDEVYERLIFENKIHQSVLKSKALADRSIAVFSFGKTFHATGWKVGYTIASERITREIRKAHQFITFSVNTPVQLALADYMQDSENYLHLGKFYQAKRDFFLEAVKGTSLKSLPCFGSYFQLMSFEGVSSKSDFQMAEWMTKEIKLASIPVSAFYKDGSDHKLLRFCFAKSEETLLKSGEILRKI